MAEKILVAHASKYGSTEAIAEAIAATLAEAGFVVDLLPAGKVRSLEEYRAVVVGSAVYMGRWRRDAMRLLRHRRDQLSERDVWLFNSGPVGEQPTGGVDADRWLRPPKVRLLGEQIGAHDLAVFGGSVAAGGGMMRRQMFKSTPEDVRDLRDWDQIRSWAGRIAATLTGSPSAPAAEVHAQPS